MAVPRAFRFGNDIWDPTHRFETSWLLPPYALFACRALISVYIFTVRFFALGWACTHPAPGSTYACQDSADSFSYFTVLTYWGLAFYFLFSAIHTFSYARTGSAPLDRFPRPLQALHALFYTTVTTYPFLVTIVFWGLLYTYGKAWFPSVYEGWSNVSQHGLNSAFALFEVVVPRTNPSPPIHMLWLIVVLALYLGVAYITRATKGFYVYSFLDPGRQRHGLVAAYVFGIALAILIIYAVVWGLIWARRWLTERKLGKMGKMGKGDRSAASSWSNEHDLEMSSRRNLAHR